MVVVVVDSSETDTRVGVAAGAIVVSSVCSCVGREGLRDTLPLRDLLGDDHFFGTGRSTSSSSMLAGRNSRTFFRRPTEVTAA